jgi:insulysin
LNNIVFSFPFNSYEKKSTAMRTCNTIIKSPYDTRSYRGLVLDNGLTCLLISDTSTTKSSAAVNVSAGSYSDPYFLPGLAHLCQHVVCQNTAKFPRDSEFQSFVKSQEGTFNAATLNASACFNFDVSTHSFERALEM